MRFGISQHCCNMSTPRVYHRQFHPIISNLIYFKFDSFWSFIRGIWISSVENGLLLFSLKFLDFEFSTVVPLSPEEISHTSSKHQKNGIKLPSQFFFSMTPTLSHSPSFPPPHRAYHMWRSRNHWSVGRVVAHHHSLVAPSTPMTSSFHPSLLVWVHKVKEKEPLS